MKPIMFSIATLLFLNISARAQTCEIQIQILENRYMFGKVEKMKDQLPIKKMEVNFSSDFMEVILPVDGINYHINVVNENCQAYCTREKRVRQLHSGDEKLVRNLFKDKEEEILSQIRSCQL